MTTSPAGGARLNRYEARTSSTMFGVAVAVIPIYVVQALASDAGSWAAGPLAIARLGIQILMGVDVGVRTYLAPRRAAFLASHKLDVLAVAVPPLRAARELVALRSILRRPGVARFSMVGCAAIVGCALVVYAAEHDRDGASIQSVGDAFWWAIVTTTTVGYGDEVPITDQGRMMAVILMMFGVALLAVLTAHIAAHFVDDEGQQAERDLVARMTGIDRKLAAVERQLDQLTSASRVCPAAPAQHPEELL